MNGMTLEELTAIRDQHEPWLRSQPGVVGTGVGRVNFAFVAVRWQSPFWRTWDWAMLVLALVHGINGLRVIALDYLRPVGLRFAVNMLFYVTGFVLFVLGTVIVFTFDPSKWPGALAGR